MNRKDRIKIILIGVFAIFVLLGIIRAVIHEIKAPVGTPPNLLSTGMG
jgi:hypothetical protein